MAAALVSSLLSSYFKVFVKGFNSNQLSFSLFSGTLTIKNACLLHLPAPARRAKNTPTSSTANRHQ